MASAGGDRARKEQRHKAGAHLLSPQCQRTGRHRTELRTQVQSLDWDDPLEKEMATHSSILVWRIPIDRGAWGSTVHEIAKSWTQLSD